MKVVWFVFIVWGVFFSAEELFSAQKVSNYVRFSFDNFFRVFVGPRSCISILKFSCYLADSQFFIPSLRQLAAEQLSR